MSTKVIDRLKAECGGQVLRSEMFQDEARVWVKPADWKAVAQFVRDDSACVMDHFIDLTAVDYPERTPEEPRFEVVLMVRSQSKNHRVQLFTAVNDGEALATVSDVWVGANWAEREVFDMFGVQFEGHPDLRRILLYEQFEGYPLRKDYPIERAQPLVPYRDVPGLEKLPPFGPDEGQPFARIQWRQRLEGKDLQVSPSIATQTGQRRTLSDSEAAEYLLRKLDRGKSQESAPNESAPGPSAKG